MMRRVGMDRVSKTKRERIKFDNNNEENKIW